MTDDEQTLWVANGNGQSLLHHSRECPTLKQAEPRQASVNEKRVLEECAECGPGETHPGRYSRWACPKCGTEVNNLPTHMRRCDGGETDE